MQWKPEIQWKPIAQVIPYARNVKKHPAEQIQKIVASIHANGFTQPIAVDKEGVIVAGHGRFEAAKQLGMKDVPVVVMDHLDEHQIAAYRIADNRVAQSEWDIEMLTFELGSLDLRGFDLDLTGFDMPELKALLPDDSETKQRLDQEQAAADAAADVIPGKVGDRISGVEPGDVWLLGSHRLMCGDSTDAEQVAKLMNGEKADMVFTDPPYGMFLDTNYDSMFSADASHRNTGDRFEKVKGDHEDFSPELINTVFAAFSYCKEIFLWGADYYSEHVPARSEGSWIVWDKRCSEEMDRVTGNTFELCWSKAKHKRLIARILWSGHHGLQGDDTKTRVHPTQKPTKLIEWFFDNWGKDTKSVVDLFGGSGSTLIACEKTNRRCFMMELDTHYVGVILRRWAEFTGQDPVREGDGALWSATMRVEAGEPEATPAEPVEA